MVPMLVWIPAAVAIWFAIGVIVAVPFLLVGIGRVVPGATGSLAFRLLVLPAAALLWPVVLRRWTAAPTERPR